MARVPDGLYRGKVTKWGVGKAKTSSNLVFWITLKLSTKVIDKTDVALDVPLEGEEQAERNITRALTASALEWLVGDLKALGFEDANLHRLDPQHPEAFDFEGKEVLLQNTSKKKDDRTFEEWKIVRPKEDPERPKEEEMDTVFSILSEQLQQTLAAKGGRTKAEIKPEDIPF